MPNFTFYGGRKQTTVSFFPFLNLDMSSPSLRKKATCNNSEKFRKNGNSRFIIHVMLTRGVDAWREKKLLRYCSRTLPLSCFLFQYVTVAVCHKRSILNVHYLQALCQNLPVDFSRDSINAVTRHSISSKKTSKNCILILHRNFSQTAADSSGEADTCGQNRFI